MMLCLSKVSKFFLDPSHPALKKIHLDVKQGEFCVIIGGNGSGKSTLLKTISGEYGCDAGKIRVEGHDITFQSLYERSKIISSVTQDTTRGTIGEMTVLENMILSSLRGKKSSFSFYGRRSKALKESLQKLELGLEKYLTTPLGFLSGGQKQVIATFMAFLSKPKLLLLDEQTSALDSKTQTHLMKYTAQRIQSENITTLMVTHDLEGALLYGTRLLMMHHGEIILDVQGDDKKKLNLKDLQKLFYHPEGSIQ